MDYKTMTINDIIDWCKQNKQVKWLKEIAAREVPCKVYPRITFINDEGKTVSKVDKTKPYKTEMRRIPYIQIKQEFIKTFMPELLPQREKKPTFYDIIENL